MNDTGTRGRGDAGENRRVNRKHRSFGHTTPPSSHRVTASPEHRVDLIFGRRPVIEALKASGRALHKIWIAEGSHGTDEILKLARERGVPVERANRHDLDRRVQGHHQGILAQASAVSYIELDAFIQRLGTVPTEQYKAPPGTVPRSVVILLDEIQDPHNIGAVLRSAAFFGASAAIMPRWRSAPVGETASRVSSGGIEHIPLIREKNLAETVLTLQNAGFEVLGADMEGSPLKEYVPGSRVALVLGSEGSGIRRLVRERCDKLLKIPGAGTVGSLNVSAAAAVFLHHLLPR